MSRDDWHLAGCPDDGPAMVDAEGTVHVVWPTVIGGATPEGALFHAVPRDGRTFSPRVRIPTLGSPKPMQPQVLADASGRITLAWDEVMSVVRQPAVRTMRFDEAGQPLFGATTRLRTPDAPSSYPVLVATPRGILAQTRDVRDPNLRASNPSCLEPPCFEPPCFEPPCFEPVVL